MWLINPLVLSRTDNLKLVLYFITYDYDNSDIRDYFELRNTIVPLGTSSPVPTGRGVGVLYRGFEFTPPIKIPSVGSRFPDRILGRRELREGDSRICLEDAALHKPVTFMLPESLSRTCPEAWYVLNNAELVTQAWIKEALKRFHGTTETPKHTDSNK